MKIGRLDFDSDLMTLEHGVYLSVYDKDSFDLLYGRIPYGFAYDLPFEMGISERSQREKLTIMFLT